MIGVLHRGQCGESPCCAARFAGAFRGCCDFPWIRSVGLAFQRRVGNRGKWRNLRLTEACHRGDLCLSGGSPSRRRGCACDCRGLGRRGLRCLSSRWPTTKSLSPREMGKLWAGESRRVTKVGYSPNSASVTVPRPRARTLSGQPARMPALHFEACAKLGHYGKLPAIKRLRGA